MLSNPPPSQYAFVKLMNSNGKGFCNPTFAIFSRPDGDRKWAIKLLSQCDQSQYIAIEQMGAKGVEEKAKILRNIEITILHLGPMSVGCLTP